MRNIILLIMALAYSLTISAQTANTLGFEFSSMDTDYEDKVRIHLVYTPATTLFAYRLHTSLQEEAIKVKDYVVLVTEDEQINFFRNTQVNDLPVRLSFEKGKDYYFRITFNAGDGFSNGFSITEMTERAFQMDIFANNISPKPKIYDYTTEATLK